jgi:hypothetical protein
MMKMSPSGPSHSGIGFQGSGTQFNAREVHTSLRYVVFTTGSRGYLAIATMRKIYLVDKILDKHGPGLLH